MQRLADRHAFFMAKAIKLALKGKYTTSPNPCVGCIIVDENRQIQAQGWHQYAGQGHAEINALNQLADNADLTNMTMYVTLEPCSHQGKTGSCAQALIQTGIKKVVVAGLDPNPLVSGSGVELLRKHGVDVIVGCLKEQAEIINSGFMQRMRNQRPFVQLKLAASLDGATAMANGQSQWITGESARLDVQCMRAKSSAILSTSQTVIRDNARLTVRYQDLFNNLEDLDAHLRYIDLHKQTPPVRVILDSQLELAKYVQENKHQLNLFNSLKNDDVYKRSKIIVVGAKDKLDEAKKLTFLNYSDQIEVLAIAYNNEHGLDLQELFQILSTMEINTLMVEAGSTLAGSLIKYDLVDECVIYYAAKFLGENTMPLINATQFTELSSAKQYKIQEVRHLSQDIKLTLIKSNTNL